MANQESEKETGLEKREARLPEGVERTHPGREFIPLADIHESETEVVVLADMPGVGPDGVEVTLERNVLTIHGRVEDLRPEGHQLAYAEYEVGDYRRTFTVSERVDRDGISASMRNGVLQLTLPKVDRSPQRIDIRAD